MVSLRAIFVRAAVRQILRRQLGPAHQVEGQRRALRHWSRLSLLPRGVSVRITELAGRPCEVLEPRDGCGDGAPILLLHGGAYCWGGPHSHRGFAARLARAAARTVLILDYRLAPEDPYPAALEDAVAACRELSQSSARYVLAGDSAGGGLTLATCARLAELSLPMPERIVLLSPWVDLTLSGATIASCADTECVLNPETLRQCASDYAGTTPLECPSCSPLFGELASTPPALVLAAGEELLLDDSCRLVAALQQIGRPVTFEVTPGLWHVWPLFAPWMPEAESSIQRIADYLHPSVAQ